MKGVFMLRLCVAIQPHILFLGGGQEANHLHGLVEPPILLFKFLLLI